MNFDDKVNFFQPKSDKNNVEKKKTNITII